MKAPRVLMMWTLLSAAPALAAGPVLTLATTTSTQDSGLLDHLLPRFQAETGVEVRVIAVGTGQALALGRRGDADLLLVHAPSAEQAFVDAGHGERRLPLMYNDFVVVGPGSDPAGVLETDSVVEALTRIADGQATFVSRGDDSGTHKRELQLWRAAGLVPAGDWYLEAGSGMAAVLRLAGDKQAYTLSDRGTWLAQGRKLGLALLHAGDPLLMNPYSLIPVDPRRHPHVEHEHAGTLIDWLRSDPVQLLIGEYGVERWGEQLFYPGPVPEPAGAR